MVGGWLSNNLGQWERVRDVLVEVFLGGGEL